MNGLVCISYIFRGHTHRIGRTGRCGRTGVATTFINMVISTLLLVHILKMRCTAARFTYSMLCFYFSVVGHATTATTTITTTAASRFPLPASCFLLYTSIAISLPRRL